MTLNSASCLCMCGCTSECRTAGGVAVYVWANTNDEPREWGLRGGTWARKGGLYPKAPGFSRFLEFISVWRTWVPLQLDTSQGREFHLNLVFKSIVVFHQMLFMSRGELFIWQGCSLCVSGGIHSLWLLHGELNLIFDLHSQVMSNIA